MYSKAIVSLAMALLLIVPFPGQGPTHSGRCRGQLEPRQLGMPGRWICTHTGWYWQNLIPPRR